MTLLSNSTAKENNSENDSKKKSFEEMNLANWRKLAKHENRLKRKRLHRMNKRPMEYENMRKNTV